MSLIKFWSQTCFCLLAPRSPSKARSPASGHKGLGRVGWEGGGSVLQPTQSSAPSPVLGWGEAAPEAHKMLPWEPSATLHSLLHTFRSPWWAGVACKAATPLELWLKYHQTASKPLSYENNKGRGSIKSRTTEIRKRAGQAAGGAGFCINQLRFPFGSEPLASQRKRGNGEVHRS